MTDITEPQQQYVQALQGKLKLSDRLLDLHCQTRFGRPFRDLSRGECSGLIDELKRWHDLPAELRRAQGQAELPGLEGVA